MLSTHMRCFAVLLAAVDREASGLTEMHEVRKTNNFSPEGTFRLDCGDFEAPPCNLPFLYAGLQSHRNNGLRDT